LNSGRFKRYFASPNVQTGSGKKPASYSVGIEFFSGGKVAEV